MNAFLDQIKFDEKGLVAAIVQDAATSELLMFAWMNREALEETVLTGKAVYYSRSRKKIWRKGESSGHFQMVKELRIDCDQDAILIKVEQEGGACHTGYYSCFYRRLEKDGRLVEVGQKVFDSEKVYGKQGE